MNINRQTKFSLLYKAILLVLLFISFQVQRAQASHVVGSDITWRCMPGTNGTFEITLVLYRDCQGVTLCSNSCGAACNYSVQISGADPSCNNVNYGGASLSLVSVRDVNPNPRCPTAKSICPNMNCVTPGTFTPGVERYEFRGMVNLGPASGIPSTCCNVRISYSLCCRNGAISTGAANANFYIESVINRCLSTNPCNSSPVLTNDPFAIVCSGQPFVFNNGAVDPDLDSLAYAFVPSLQSAGASVNYIPPYSFDRPMPWSGPFNGVFPAGISANRETGDIMFTPNAGGNFVGVMAIAVQQWRRNANTGVYELVGTTRRDIQMWLRVCDPNNPPRITTLPGLNGNPQVPRTAWDVCAGENLCFDVIAKDTDFNPPTLSDTTYLSWNQALAGFGATFLPNYVPAQRRTLGPREDNFRFCWTPSEAMGSELPYYFTIRADDSRCPVPGSITRAFSVKVWERANVNIGKIDQKCGKWSLTYVKNKNTQQFLNTTWSIAREPNDFSFGQGATVISNVQTTPILTFTKGGKYLVNLTIDMRGPNGGFCSKTFTDTLTVVDPLSVAKRDTFLCKGNTITLSIQGSSGGPPYTYRWFNNIKDTLIPLNAPFFTNASITVSPTQTRYYTVQVRDLNGCRSWDSIRVEQKALPVGLLPDSMRICYGTSYELDPGTNGNNMKSYIWSTGDTTRTIERSDSNRYVVFMTDTNNCQNRDTMMLYVNRQIIANAGLDTNICFRDTATLVGSGGQRYQWRNLNTGTIVRAKNYEPRYKASPTNTAVPTRYEVTVYQSYPDTAAKVLECFVTDTVEVTVKPLPVLVRPQVVRSCFSNKQTTLNAFNTNQPGGTGVWSYPTSPGAIIPGPPAQVRFDSLASKPPQDTTAVYTNWIYYIYTAPETFGGCVQRDSAQVVIYGNPRVNGGTRVLLCENSNNFEITNVANQQQRGVAPIMLGGLGVGFHWIGNGVDSVITSNSKRFFFNPTSPNVSKLPAINILNYRYVHSYNIVGGGQLQCSNSDTVQFTVTEIPDIEAGNDIVVCKNNPIFNLTDKSGGFTIPPTGQEYWTSPNAQIQGGISARTTFNPMGSTVPESGGPYKMYMRDTSTGCAVVDSINITIARVPDVTISFSANKLTKDTLYCKQSGYHPVWTTVNGVSSAGVTQSTDTAYSYQGSAAWEPGAAGTTNSTGRMNTDHVDANGTVPLIFRFTQVTAGIACTSYDTARAEIQIPPTISVTAGGSICSYDNTIPVSVASLEPSIYSMQWSSSDGTFDNGNALSTGFSPNQQSKDNGTATITATTIQLGPCPTATDGTTITIHQKPVPQILCDSCQGCEPLRGYVAAGPSGVTTGVTHQWLWSDGYSQNTTDSSFMRGIDKYSDVVNGKATVRLVLSTQTEPVCRDTSAPTDLIIHATPKAAFNADPPCTTIAKPFFNFVNQSTSPDNAPMSFEWTFAKLGETPGVRKSYEINPINIEFDADTGEIPVYLRAVTEYGCWDTTSRKIYVEPDITVFIPNAFRPGSDVDCPEGDLDCNKAFKVAADGYATIDIIVFNRWGQQVFRTNNHNIGWKGTVNNVNGQECPQDVYIYQIYATSFNGKQYKYSGSVTLLR